MQNTLLMIVRGIAIGAIISAPMGPVGILCVQRTLDGGRRHGFYTGIGAAASDLFYCLLTGFGLSFIEGFLQANQQIIQILGSLVLIGFGIYIMKKNPTKSLTKPRATAGMKGKDVLSGFLFTFSNPLILFLIVGLFARFNFQSPEYRWYHYIVGYLAIVAGAVGWWWLITFVINKIRAHFNLRSMWIVNRVIGIIILIFAVFGIVSAFWPDAEARKTPAERILRTERVLTYDEPTITLSAPGPEKGLFSCSDFKCLDPGTDILTGIDFCLTSHRSSPTKKYEYLNEKGQLKKKKTPGFSIVLRSAGGEEGRITFRSAEPLSYQGEDTGCETEITIPGPENKSIRTVRLAGELKNWDISLDFSEDRGDISVNGKPTIDFTLGHRVTDVDFETEPGGEMSIEGLKMWVRNAPVYNKDIVSRIEAGDDIETVALETLPEEPEGSVGPDGLWNVYSYSADETYMRSGGSYCLLILPDRDHDSAKENGYEIWYISGAAVLPDDWKAGRLKGRLKPTPYSDDWEAEWLDAEGRSCGPAVRARLSGDRLTFLFPRHGSEIRLVRRLKGMLK